MNTPELVSTIRFGVAGNSLGHLGGGWAQAEAGFTWTVGAESSLLLPLPRAHTDYVMLLDVVPYIHPPAHPAQRLIVVVNGRVVGSSSVSRPSLLAYRIPADPFGRADQLTVTLLHPDAARPMDFPGEIDQRTLGFSVRTLELYQWDENARDRSRMAPAGLMLRGDEAPGLHAPADLEAWVLRTTGLDPARFAMQFESLGENCEFGLLQRHFGAEPLGLLRFSSTFLRNLIAGLQSDFEGLGTLDDIEPRLTDGDRKEFMVHERRYGLVYHTFVYEGERSLWLMREQEAARLSFLRRKFLEECEAGEKIFVYKRNTHVSEAEVLSLSMFLNKRARNTLLWVTPAERNRPPGTVELLRNGLFRGYIDRFAPDDDAHDLSVGSWTKLCVNVYLLSRLRSA